MHVPERLDPQGGQSALGAAEQAVGHQVGGDRGHHDRERGHPGHRGHEARVGAARAVEAAVEGLLHRDRHHDPPERSEHGEHDGAAQALGELRGELDAAPDGAPGAQLLPRVDGRGGPSGDLLGGHRSPTLDGSCSCS